MEKNTICYALYNNKKQEKLHALANSKEELKEVSLKYESGVWFEYDVWVREGHSDLLFNEKLYRGKSKFGEEINKEVILKQDKTGLFLHSGIGDIR